LNLNDIGTQLLFTTIPIWIEKGNGLLAHATGFFYMKDVPNKGPVPLIVTNKHVVENATRGVLGFVKADSNRPLVNQRITVEITDRKILTSFLHPKYDLAVFPVGPLINRLTETGKSILFRSIMSDIVPNKEIIEGLSAIEEITFIGYPSGLFDHKNNAPIIRQGITASPIWNDFNGEPVFLIDAGVYPGSSGSPVFIYNRGAYPTKNGITVGTRLLFLGILSETLTRKEESKIYLGLGKVIKSEVVMNFIDYAVEKLTSSV